MASPAENQSVMISGIPENQSAMVAPSPSPVGQTEELSSGTKTRAPVSHTNILYPGLTNCTKIITFLVSFSGRQSSV